MIGAAVVDVATANEGEVVAVCTIDTFANGVVEPKPTFPVFVIVKNSDTPSRSPVEEAMRKFLFASEVPSNHSFPAEPKTYVEEPVEPLIWNVEVFGSIQNSDEVVALPPMLRMSVAFTLNRLREPATLEVVVAHPDIFPPVFPQSCHSHVAPVVS
jgi:hypothetical protein